MLNKERLEEIEERVLVDKVYYKYLDGTKGHWGKIYTLNEEDYNYLKEQAKRVQELEESIVAYHIELSIKDNANKRIKKKNKRYREARNKIEERYDKEYEIQANEYMGGIADGLMVAMGIIDKELEK